MLCPSGSRGWVVSLPEVLGIEDVCEIATTEDRRTDRLTHSFYDLRITLLPRSLTACVPEFFLISASTNQQEGLLLDSSFWLATAHLVLCRSLQ